VGLSKERHNLLAGCPCVLCGDRGGSLDRPVPGASYGGPIITSCWVSGPDASFSYALDASIDLKESCQSRHCPSSSNAQQIAQGDLTCPNFFILITHTHTHTHTHTYIHTRALPTQVDNSARNDMPLLNFWVLVLRIRKHAPEVGHYIRHWRNMWARCASGGCDGPPRARACGCAAQAQQLSSSAGGAGGGGGGGGGAGGRVKR